MPEKTPQDINQIQEAAKAQERNDQTAQELLDNAVSQMGPQRQYSEDKSQNKR